MSSRELVEEVTLDEALDDIFEDIPFFAQLPQSEQDELLVMYIKARLYGE